METKTIIAKGSYAEIRGTKHHVTKSDGCASNCAIRNVLFTTSSLCRYAKKITMLDVEENYSVECVKGEDK